VLLVEAGNDTPPGEEPEDVRDPFYVAAYNRDYMWPDMRVTWTNDAPGGPRSMWYEQARIMGGGSSVNSMIGLRGHPADFAQWAEFAGPQWSWENVAPYYHKLERDLDFANPEHGADGPIPIRRHARKDWPPFCKAVERVLVRRGIPYVPDANAAGAGDGICAVPMTNLPSQRVSAAMAYLTPAVRARSNLTILARTHVTKLRFVGSRVVGIDAVKDGQPLAFDAANVVVSAGSLHTPALLMRSGIGAGEDLARLGIEVRIDRPGVGANLQEHPVVALAAYLKPQARQATGMRAHGNLSLRYSSGMPGCAGQDMYMAISNKTSWHALGLRLSYVAVLLQQPFSRGSVRLRSSDWREEPDVQMNVLSDPRDLDRMTAGIRYALDIVSDPLVAETCHDVFLASFSERVQSYNRVSAWNAFRSKLAVTALDWSGAGLRTSLIRHVIAPHSDARRIAGTPDSLKAWLKQNTTGYYHVSGTCRLGRESDRMAVVRADGAVIGAQNLYIADNSLMPTIVKSQTNLTAMMIGEKMADSLKTAIPA
jgi:5-(hydroxymethyl)furfural/furfural oxidase